AGIPARDEPGADLVRRETGTLDAVPDLLRQGRILLQRLLQHLLPLGGRRDLLGRGEARHDRAQQQREHSANRGKPHCADIPPRVRNERDRNLIPKSRHVKVLAARGQRTASRSRLAADGGSAHIAAAHRTTVRHPIGESIAVARKPRTLQQSTEGTPSTGAPLPGTDIRLVRLALHRRAPENLRRQFTRAALRVASLVVADLLVLVALRELHRLIGDVGWLLPRGYLTVWQDASALVLGLAVTGNYGPGDDHRDPARLFGGCALATALLLWSAPWSRSLVPVLLQCVPTVVVVWGAVVAERAVVDLLVQRFAPSPSIMVPTLAVGSLAGFKDLVAGQGLWWMQDCRSVGFVDVATPPSAASLGGLADLPHLLDELKVERVVMCGYIPDGEFARVLDAAVVAGCALLAIPPWSLHA